MYIFSKNVCLFLKSVSSYQYVHGPGHAGHLTSHRLPCRPLGAAASLPRLQQALRQVAIHGNVQTSA